MKYRLAELTSKQLDKLLEDITSSNDKVEVVSAYLESVKKEPVPIGELVVPPKALAIYNELKKTDDYYAGAVKYRLAELTSKQLDKLLEDITSSNDKVEVVSAYLESVKKEPVPIGELVVPPKALAIYNELKKTDDYYAGAVKYRLAELTSKQLDKLLEDITSSNDKVEVVSAYLESVKKEPVPEEELVVPSTKEKKMAAIKSQLSKEEREILKYTLPGISESFNSQQLDILLAKMKRSKNKLEVVRNTYLSPPMNLFDKFNISDQEANRITALEIEILGTDAELYLGNFLDTIVHLTPQQQKTMLVKIKESKNKAGVFFHYLKDHSNRYPEGYKWILKQYPIEQEQESEIKTKLDEQNKEYSIKVPEYGPIDPSLVDKSGYYRGIKTPKPAYAAQFGQWGQSFEQTDYFGSLFNGRLLNEAKTFNKYFLTSGGSPFGSLGWAIMRALAGLDIML